MNQADINNITNLQIDVPFRDRRVAQNDVVSIVTLRDSRGAWIKEHARERSIRWVQIIKAGDRFPSELHARFWTGDELIPVKCGEIAAEDLVPLYDQIKWLVDQWRWWDIDRQAR